MVMTQKQKISIITCAGILLLACLPWTHEAVAYFRWRSADQTSELPRLKSLLKKCKSDTRDQKYIRQQMQSLAKHGDFTSLIDPVFHGEYDDHVQRAAASALYNSDSAALELLESSPGNSELVISALADACTGKGLTPEFRLRSYALLCRIAANEPATTRITKNLLLSSTPLLALEAFETARQASGDRYLDTVCAAYRKQTVPAYSCAKYLLDTHLDATGVMEAMLAGLSSSSADFRAASTAALAKILEAHPDRIPEAETRVLRLEAHPDYTDLYKLIGPASLMRLAHGMRDTALSAADRGSLVSCFAEFGPDALDFAPELFPLLAQTDTNLVYNVQEAVARFCTLAPNLQTNLYSLVEDRFASESARLNAIRTVGLLEAPSDKVLTALAHHLNTDKGPLSGISMMALDRLGLRAAGILPALAPLFDENREPGFRYVGARVLASVAPDDPRIADSLAALSQNENAQFREAAVALQKQLGLVGDEAGENENAESPSPDDAAAAE